MNTSPSLTIAPLLFQLTGELPPAPASYSLWHGLIGKQLKTLAPSLFDMLYDDRSDRARLYALRVPQHPDNQLRLTLMGQASQHALVLTEVLRQAGTNGWDKPFQVTQGVLETPSGLQLFFDERTGLLSQPESYPASDLMTPSAKPIQCLTLHLTSPMILKEGNAVFRQAPDFAFLLKRLLGRIAQACHTTQSDPLYSKLQSTFLLAKACDIKLNRAILKEVTMHRQSGRTGSRMAFTGFTGKLVYDGDLTPFMGILRLGEHLQVGGKTAFGFGAYRLEPHPSSAQEHQP